jgi:hypothetical protein
MSGNVSMIDGHIDDDIWEQLDNRGAYYDGYRCKKCKTIIIVEDALDLPCYCKECEKYEKY